MSCQGRSTRSQQLRLLKTPKVLALSAGAGYGSMHTLAPHLKANNQRKDDGLWLMDIQTKEAKLLVSLHELSRRLHTQPFSNAKDLTTGLPYKFTTGTKHQHQTLTVSAKRSSSVNEKQYPFV